jgi:hypothetical protein
MTSAHLTDSRVLILAPVHQTYTMFYMKKLSNFLLPTLSPKLTFPFLTTSATSKVSMMADLEGLLLHSAVLPPQDSK